MSTSLIPAPASGKGAGGFWNLKNWRPDSVFGKLLTIGAVGAGLYFGLPVIREILENVVAIIGLGFAALAGVAAAYVLYLAWTSGAIARFFKLADYGIQILSKRITGIFIAIAPIDVMKARLREIIRLLSEVARHIASVRAARKKAQDTLDQCIAERDHHDSMVEQAALHPTDNSEEDAAHIAQHTRAADRRVASIETFTKLVAMMDMGIKILEKLQRKANYVRDDIVDTITHSEQQRKALQATTQAIRAMQRILHGGDVGAEFYNEALEIANQQATEMIGEIQQFLSDTKGMMRDFDLEQFAAVENAMRRIEARSGSKALTYEQGDMKRAIALSPVVTRELEAQASDSAADVRRFLDS